MEKLKMHTTDQAEENFRRLSELFPGAVTETITGYEEDGRAIVERAVDADVLRQEISAQVVEGPMERYQFTWPDKKRAVVLANAPIAKTLRLDRQKSAGRDGAPGSIDTENLYIEGDNLDALKLLQESYLGRVKLIYIDPPYNTGSDFLYADDFSRKAAEYRAGSGQYDEYGNRLVQNTESNGRFHTDWLNMLYPRLRIAKNLLSEDGAIFISIDDNEVDNLRKICDEVFGRDNSIAVFPRLATRSGKTPTAFMVSHDYVLCYAKSRHDIFVGQAFEDDSYKYADEYVEERGRYNLKQPLDCNSISYSASLDYPITHEGITYYPGSDYGKYMERQNGRHLPKDYAWRWSRELFQFGLENGWIVFQNGRIYTKGYLNAAIKKQQDGSYRIVKREKKRRMSTVDFLSNDYSNDIAKRQLAAYELAARFDFPKPVNLIKTILSSYYDRDCLVLDFFSGSATTAEAVLCQNREDGGRRRFILVQLPEEIQSEAYHTICDIGEERIRRAGGRLREEDPKAAGVLDLGFRVFRVDSTNMRDVYYRPMDYKQEQAELLVDNIKEDRTAEDLLFQVMLDLGILPSSRIEETEIAGKKVFSVGEGELAACFDDAVTEETIMEIALRRPACVALRDLCFADDSAAASFEWIFETYSPKTRRKVL